MKLYKVSADGGKSWTTQWFCDDEAARERSLGHLVFRTDSLI